MLQYLLSYFQTRTPPPPEKLPLKQRHNWKFWVCGLVWAGFFPINVAFATTFPNQSGISDGTTVNWPSLVVQGATNDIQLGAWGTPHEFTTQDYNIAKSNHPIRIFFPDGDPATSNETPSVSVPNDRIHIYSFPFTADAASIAPSVSVTGSGCGTVDSLTHKTTVIINDTETCAITVDSAAGTYSGITLHANISRTGDLFSATDICVEGGPYTSCTTAPTPVTTTTAATGTVPGTNITYTITSPTSGEREIRGPATSDSDLWSWSNNWPEWMQTGLGELTVEFSNPVPIHRLVFGVISFTEATFTLTVAGGTASTSDFDLSDGISPVAGAGTRPVATYNGATGEFVSSGTIDQHVMVGSTSTKTITSFTIEGASAGGEAYTLFFGTTELTVQASDATVNEHEGTVDLTVSLSAVADVNVTVDYVTSDGTAVAPDDYTSTSGTATIPAGQTSTTITVPIISDNLEEGNETFNVNLSNPVNAIIPYTVTGESVFEDSQAKVTISDSDLFDFATTTVGTGQGTVTGSTADGAYPSGTTITLVATPDAGSTFAGWSPASCVDGFSLSAATTCTASFSLNSYSVTPSAGDNGSISPATGQTVDHGSTTVFTVTPNAGYTAAVGGTCGGSLAGTTYTTNAVTADCTVAATFSLNSYSVTPSAGANGSITPNTVQSVNHGSTTAFTVTPNAGYTAAVGGTCGGSLAGTAYTTNAITAPCTVDATFTLNTTYAITTAATVITDSGLDAGPGGGTVSCSPNPAPEGRTVTCTAYPEPGFVFVGFSGDCSGESCEIEDISGPISLTATFAPEGGTASAAQPIPVLGGWGLFALSGLLGLAGWRIRRKMN